MPSFATMGLLIWLGLLYWSGGNPYLWLFAPVFITGWLSHVYHRGDHPAMVARRKHEAGRRE